MKKKRPAAPVSDEPTPEQLAELNGGGAPAEEDDGPSEEQLAELSAPPEESEASFAGAASARAAVPSALQPRAGAPTDLEATAAGQGAAAAGRSGAPPERGFFGSLAEGLKNPVRELVQRAPEGGLTTGRAFRDPAGAARAAGVGMGQMLGGGALPPPEKALQDFREWRTTTNDGTENVLRDPQMLRALTAQGILGTGNAKESLDEHEAMLIGRANAAEAHPGAVTVGQAVVPNPVGKGAGMLVPGAGAVARAARPIVAGAGAGAFQSGVGSAVAGNSPGRVLEDTVQGAAGGALMSTAGVATGKAAGAASRGLGVIFPNVRRFAEARATKIQSPATERGPGPSDLIEEAEALPRGNRGVDEAAIGARDRIKSTMEGRAAEEGRIYNEGVPALPGMKEIQRIPQVHRELNRAVPRLSNGRVATGAKGAAALVEGVKENLTSTVGHKIEPVTEAELQTNIRKREMPAGHRVRRITAEEAAQNPRRSRGEIVGQGMEPDPARPGENVARFDPGDELQRPAATGEDMLKERRGLRKMAFESGAETPETVAAKTGYRALNKALKGTPEKPGAIKGLAALDDRYSNFKRAQQRHNDILLRSEEGGRTVQLPEQLGAEDFDAAEPAPKWRVNDDIRAARTIARINDDTIPARDMAPYFRELMEDPEFKAALDKVVAKKALEETRVLSGPGQGEQVGLHDVSGAGAALKFGVKKLGAIARKVDDRVLRHAKGGASVPFFGRLGSKKRKQDEEEAR